MYNFKRRHTRMELGTKCFSRQGSVQRLKCLISNEQFRMLSPDQHNISFYRSADTIILHAITKNGIETN